MIAIEQDAAVRQAMLGAVGERIIRQPQARRAQRIVMRDPTKREQLAAQVKLVPATRDTAQRLTRRLGGNPAGAKA